MKNATPFKSYEVYNINKKNGFIRITRSLMNSEAYKNLSPAAVRLYILLKEEQLNPKGIEFPYSKFKQHFSKTCFQEAKKCLIDNGFITQDEQDNWRCNATYRPSDRWKQISLLPPS